ncbi:hypothetical protein WJX81_001686 [Elliptochloris bilobata]|uniref:Uncharacterized protein n=1 Tax=Elliptochloris bilobata TaxID=381761 RepID=A0AAW1QXY3_9CHLO
MRMQPLVALPLDEQLRTGVAPPAVQAAHDAADLLRLSRRHAQETVDAANAGRRAHKVRLINAEEDGARVRRWQESREAADRDEGAGARRALAALLAAVPCAPEKRGLLRIIGGIGHHRHCAGRLRPLPSEAPHAGGQGAASSEEEDANYSPAGKRAKGADGQQTVKRPNRRLARDSCRCGPQP